MKKTLVAAMMLLVCSTILAAGIPDKIKALHKDGETMKTSFTETSVMPKLKKEQAKSGSLVFTAPSNLRLDYTDPAGDYTLITAMQFETSREGKVQKLPFKNPQSQWAVFRNTLLMSFMGDVEGVASMNEATATYKEEGANYVCTLKTDKPKQQGIAELVLVYNKKSGKLVSLTVTKGNGNYTTYAVK
ncbi:MAG: outer membrane lipoprotein carrier protein LolA [Bacteroidales bacterium]|nr:outer membrane lipoprotein carrier protein LolA [Candidatus Colicola faecequi]